MENSQSLNHYSYVQGNPVSLTDPFGLSPINWRNFGHGLLNIIGMCPCIIGVASDVINSIWYYAEKDYAMGTLSLFCALPGIGDAGNCIKFLKGTKALKYFQVGTKFVGNAVIFGTSATGAYRSVKEVYQNIKDGDLLSLDTLVNTASAGINVISMILSGKQVIGAGKDVRSIYLEKQESKWSSKKSGTKDYDADNATKAEVESNSTNSTVKKNEPVDTTPTGNTKPDYTTGIGKKANFDNEVPRTGEEWDAYLKEKYGADNVKWENKGGSNTPIKPSGSYNPDAKPSGTPTKITDNMDEATERSLRRENETAETLAKNGYDIEQNPTIEGTTRNPDYLIEGEIFDCYSPAESTSVRNIASTIEEKVIKKKQTNNVVLNLDDWEGDINALIKQLNDFPIKGLKEVLVVQNGNIISIYP